MPQQFHSSRHRVAQVENLGIGLGVAFNVNEQQAHHHGWHQPANHGNQNPGQKRSCIVASHDKLSLQVWLQSRDGLQDKKLLPLVHQAPEDGINPIKVGQQEVGHEGSPHATDKEATGKFTPAP